MARRRRRWNSFLGWNQRQVQLPIETNSNLLTDSCYSFVLAPSRKGSPAGLGERFGLTLIIDCWPVFSVARDWLASGQRHLGRVCTTLQSAGLG
jgi:hypothetical protein